MGISQLQGTPWHIEYLKKDEDDKEEKRRHKNRCKFYKHYNNCKLINIHDRCFGSNNCRDYEEKTKENGKKFEPIDIDRENQKKKIAKIKAKSEKQKKVIKLKVGTSFKVKDVKTNEIIEYTIVSKEDEDIFDCKITADSPLALKVAQSKNRDLIFIETKNSKIIYRLLTFA